MLWTLPLWPVGLGLACLVWLSGGTLRWCHGVLIAQAYGRLGEAVRSRGWKAHAFPPVVVFWGLPRTFQLYVHEVEHLRQGVALGPLQPLVYGLLWLVYGYRKHPLEVHARAVARGEAEK